MTSKAFFKSAIKPKLLYRLQSTCQRRAVEVWTTTCIVTNFGKGTKADCSVLINPSNPQLSGVKNFPYFPRGGPVPKEKPHSMHKDWQPLGFVSTWGGMEVGEGMMFPVSVVDGLVHQQGGWKLQAECAWRRVMATPDEACPVGTSVKTSAGTDRLGQAYDCIVHTTPPFYKHDDSPEPKLFNCYSSAIQLACEGQRQEDLRIATPLLGSGARGFPYDVATEVASKSCVQWCKDADSRSFPEKRTRTQEFTVAFGILEESVALKLAEEIELLASSG